MSREIFLVGSVPLKPASKVFECVCDHGLAPLMRRIPDGEQGGWALALMPRLRANPAFEQVGEPLPLTQRATTFFDQLKMRLNTLRPGTDPDTVEVGEFGVAESARTSYAEFKAFRDEGKFAPDTRFCVTLAGPCTAFAGFVGDPKVMFPIMERAFKAEIDRVLEVVPAKDLAIQIDLAGEVEMEEYRRRPQDWDMPLFEASQSAWPMPEVVQLIAKIGDHVPKEAELGFHLCALYHIDQSQGQDIAVHVDWCNALTEATRRQIDYIHIPTVPDHDEDDFAPLANLRLKPETTLFIGVIHAEDGGEGSERRIQAAAKHYPNFGVAAFCGLAQPSRVEFRNPHSVGDIFEMHRAAAVNG